MTKPNPQKVRDAMLDKAAKRTARILDRIGAVSIVKSVADRDTLRRFKNDDAITYFVARELEYVKAKVWEDKYRPHKAFELIPVESDVHPGAKNVVWYEEALAGVAKIVSSYADDLPQSDVGTRENTRTILTVAGSFGYSFKDMLASAFTGRALDAAKARSLKHNIERTIDGVAAIGHTASGITGMLNNASVATTSLASGAWATATADEMLRDMSDCAGAVFSASQGVFEADTLVLPVAEYQIAAQKRLGDTETTVLQFFLATNPFIKEVTHWWRLDTAGAASVARMVAYRKDPDVLHIEMPMLFDMLDPQEKNLAAVVPGLAMTAGCIVTRPLAMQYADFTT